MPMMYRITSAKYAKDHSGRGAFLYGGRWNSKGNYALYAAETVSLAMLEVLIHIYRPPTRPHVLITYQADNDLIKNAIGTTTVPDVLDTRSLPVSQKVGDHFLSNDEVPILAIPSIMHRFEKNYLINPKHNLSNSIEVVDISTFTFDQRFFKNAED